MKRLKNLFSNVGFPSEAQKNVTISPPTIIAAAQKYSYQKQNHDSRRYYLGPLDLIRLTADIPFIG
jgi:hypothetical protein